MSKFFQAIFHTFRLSIIIVGCMLLFYYGIMWVKQEYDDYQRYEEPEGAAVKVFKLQEKIQRDWFERLLLFYQNGE